MYFSETHLRWPCMLLLLSQLVALLIWGTAVILDHLRMGTPFPSLLFGFSVFWILDFPLSWFISSFCYSLHSFLRQGTCEVYFNDLADLSFSRFYHHISSIVCLNGIQGSWPPSLSFEPCTPLSSGFQGCCWEVQCCSDTCLLLVGSFLLSGNFIGSY